MALLWATALGYPLAWHKTAGGRAVDWVGAHLLISPPDLRVEIPRAKAEDVLALILATLRRGTVPRRDIRSLAGKLSYFAGLVPRLRAFVALCGQRCATP